MEPRTITDQPLVDRRSPRRSRHFARGRAAVGALIFVAAIGAGCSSDDPAVIEDDAALPGNEPEIIDDGATAPGDASIVPGTGGDPDTANADFEGIRLYPGSDPVGSKTTEDGVVSQSFSVAGSDPNVVLSHFVNTLSGWEQTGVDDIGEGLRTEFRSPDGQVLEVSATTIADDDATQYSMVLSG